MKKKKDVLRIGNIAIQKIDGQELQERLSTFERRKDRDYINSIFKDSFNCDVNYDYLVIRNVANNWQVCYRSDSSMYSNIINLCSEKQLHKYLEMLITTFYLITNMIDDPDVIDAKKEFTFVNGLDKLIEDYIALRAKYAKKSVEDEETAIKHSAIIEQAYTEENADDNK